MYERELFAHRRYLVKIAPFDRRIVKRVKIVEGPNGVAGTQQSLANMRANKPGATSDQKIHEGNM